MEGLPLSFDPKIFIFSIVNFVILLFVLKKVLFAPAYNILAERKTKIKKGLDQIEEAKKEREQVNIDKVNILAKASEDSQEIIKQAEKEKKEIVNNGEKEAENIIKESRGDIAKEREELKREMHGALIDLVSVAADKALSNVNKQESQNKLIENAILQSLQDSE
ncbi:MAG: F0F1 ATP synthase subunit B [bacterium]